jgi:crotonobetainyl-CoA:carnitine CoA-transferase CaiB-like acyl-CoA transferase
MPLSQLNILDLTHVRAGPFCTRLFAGFGARVIKIERPGVGDRLRRSGPFVDGVAGAERSIPFLWLNAAKDSVTLDLKSPRGCELLLELARRSHLLIENFAPGVMARLGLDAVRLREVNPRLVVVSISNFGQDGPYRDFKADESVLYAMSGGMIATGDPDKPPLASGPAITQYTAGLHAYIAALAALGRVGRGGDAEHVDVSIQESALENVEIHLSEYAQDGKVARRNGDQHPLVPWRAYPCRDGYAAVIGAPMRRWPEAARRLFGEESPLAAPEMAHAGARIARRADVESLVRDWLRSRDKQDVYRDGQAAGLAFGFVAGLAEVLASPQHAARGFIGEFDAHPLLGRLAGCTAPFRGRGWTWRMGRAPLLGEHTDAVLSELGLPAQEASRLAAAGVV